MSSPKRCKLPKNCLTQEKAEEKNEKREKLTRNEKKSKKNNKHFFTFNTYLHKKIHTLLENVFGKTLQFLVYKFIS